MRLTLILSHARPGKRYLYARWIADEGGARTRSGQTLQIGRSVPIYAEVCMMILLRSPHVDNTTELRDKFN